MTAIDTTAALGALDLEVHYTPDTAQAVQLQDPPTARKQVTEVMMALLALQPELHEAFHGIWVHADRGESSLLLVGIADGPDYSRDTAAVDKFEFCCPLSGGRRRLCLGTYRFTRCELRQDVVA